MAPTNYDRNWRGGICRDFPEKYGGFHWWNGCKGQRGRDFVITAVRMAIAARL